MNLLTEGIELKAVIPTNRLKKLVIDNHSNSYEVYKIRLDMLYFNEQNDRIATWISQYKMNNNISEFNTSGKEEYNSIIHEFITDSNKELLKRTQKNIEMVGQQEVGVILSDGRIIDGNRRFTCLRNIQKEKNKTQYLEAVILDHNIKNNAKEIKMLELMLQHGTDEKVGYNPIDKLVGIYNDIIETELLTIQEYAKSVNQSESSIAMEVEKAKLMVEFLDFINAPRQFHIARNFNLAELLQELELMLKKINDDDKKEDLKNSVFAQLLIQPLGDTRQYIRKVRKIVNNVKFLDDFLMEQADCVEKVCEELEKTPKVTDLEISKIRANEEIKSEFLHNTEKFLNKVVGDETRNQPAKQVERANDILDTIDQNIFPKLAKEQKMDVVYKLDLLEEMILELRRSLDV